MVDARLPDGSRVHVVLPPLAVDGPVVTIRRFGATAVPLAEFCGPAVAGLLAEAMGAGRNIVVSGGTGAGKTTLLNALCRLLPRSERVVTVEDAAELRLPGDHVVRLETRPATADGLAAVGVRALVRAALRMRPDRIVVGEVRGPEALDMVQAMNTGHGGCLSTCHANGPVDALRRVETMALLGDAGVPLAAVRSQMAGALDLVVHVVRAGGPRRRVAAVAEVIDAPGSTDREVAVRPLTDGDRVTAALRPPAPAGRRRPRLGGTVSAAGALVALAAVFACGLHPVRAAARHRARARLAPPGTPRPAARPRARHAGARRSRAGDGMGGRRAEGGGGPGGRGLGDPARGSPPAAGRGAPPARPADAGGARPARDVAALRGVADAGAARRRRRARPAARTRGRRPWPGRPNAAGRCREVLDEWSASHDDPGTRLAATALVLATVVGSTPARAVDGVAATLRERLDLAAERRALAVQARTSALVLSVAPVGFAALLVVGDTAAAGFLLGTPAGWSCLGLGLALDAAGAWWMTRLSRSDGW